MLHTVRYSALQGGACHYQPKASWPKGDATKSGRLTAALEARFLAALVSAWLA